MNVAYNGVGEESDPLKKPPAPTGSNGHIAEESYPVVATEVDPEEGDMNGLDAGKDIRPQSSDNENGRRPLCKGKVRVNEGDAWSVKIRALIDDD